MNASSSSTLKIFRDARLSVVSFDSGMPREVHQQESSKADVEHLHMSVWVSTEFSFTESVDTKILFRTGQSWTTCTVRCGLIWTVLEWALALAGLGNCVLVELV